MLVLSKIIPRRCTLGGRESQWGGLKVTNDEIFEAMAEKTGHPVFDLELEVDVEAIADENYLRGLIRPARPGDGPGTPMI